jgi:hypothetical protein
MARPPCRTKWPGCVAFIAVLVSLTATFGGPGGQAQGSVILDALEDSLSTAHAWVDSQYGGDLIPKRLPPGPCATAADKEKLNTLYDRWRTLYGSAIFKRSTFDIMSTSVAAAAQAVETAKQDEITASQNLAFAKPTQEAAAREVLNQAKAKVAAAEKHLKAQRSALEWSAQELSKALSTAIDARDTYREFWKAVEAKKCPPTTGAVTGHPFSWAVHQEAPMFDTTDAPPSPIVPPAAPLNDQRGPNTGDKPDPTEHSGVIDQPSLGPSLVVLPPAAHPNPGAGDDQQQAPTGSP